MFPSSPDVYRAAAAFAILLMEALTKNTPMFFYHFIRHIALAIAI